MATLHRASLSAPFFQQHLLNLCLCVTLWSFSQYSKLFHYYYICYGDLWLVISGVIIVIVLGYHKPCPYEMVNLMGKCCVCSDCSTAWLLPALPPSPWASLFTGTHSIEIRPINNPTIAFKVFKWKEELRVSPFKSQLEMIKFGEEGMAKAETGQTPGLWSL